MSLAFSTHIILPSHEHCIHMKLKEYFPHEIFQSCMKPENSRGKEVGVHGKSNFQGQEFLEAWKILI